MPHPSSSKDFFLFGIDAEITFGRVEILRISDEIADEPGGR
jgi:hypothetical protein